MSRKQINDCQCDDCYSSTFYKEILHKQSTEGKHTDEIVGFVAVLQIKLVSDIKTFQRRL